MFTQPTLRAPRARQHGRGSWEPCVQRGRELLAPLARQSPPGDAAQLTPRVHSSGGPSPAERTCAGQGSAGPGGRGLARAWGLLGAGNVHGSSRLGAVRVAAPERQSRLSQASRSLFWVHNGPFSLRTAFLRLSAVCSAGLRETPPPPGSPPGAQARAGLRGSCTCHAAHICSAGRDHVCFNHCGVPSSWRVSEVFSSVWGRKEDGRGTGGRNGCVVPRV